MPKLEERRILLFGASAGAQEAYTVLDSHGLAGRIVAVCDNDAAKHGTMFRHLPVQALADVPRESYDYVVIGSIPGKVAITAQLESLGLRMRSEFGTLWFLLDQVLKTAA
jgi:FlaA1/EpsC-like NDP-sugar epimerase